MSKAKKQKNANKHRALSAQQTIPYIAMHPDGICQLPGGLYTKTLEYEDINYAVASTEDQTAIISGWSACLNYFDSSLPFQLSFVNRRSRNANRYKVNIPAQEDDFNSIRGEYVEMLKGQIAKSNNGIERYKYITFGLPAEGAAEARPRLGRVEADVMGNLKRLGVQSRPLDGRDRLAVLHGQMHPGGREPFRFAWKDIPKTGMGTKDYIAPDSFDFRQSRTFRVGQMWGAASYLQIMASELSDKLLAEILELDAELTVTMHIQTADQLKAIKTIKGKISDIGRMKAEEQKKAVRAGYDMEILPPDLITFSKDAAELLSDLQSRNERMFLLTFMRSSRPSCWKTAGALRWGIILPLPRPMSHGLAMMTGTVSGSMNGGITAATVPLWNRTLRRGCRSTSAFTMSVSSRPRPPAFTSITPPSAPWTLGHSRSRPATPQMRSSTTISASRLKMDRFWRGGI